MVSINLFFLIANTALLVLLALVLIKDGAGTPSAILGAILALSAAASGLVGVSLEWGWRALEIPLNFIWAAAPVAFWLCTKSLFEDTFRWKWIYLLWYLGLMTAGAIGHYLTFGDFRGMVHWFLRSEAAYGGLALLPLLMGSAILVVIGVYTALKDWRVDLVKSRRRARMVSVLLGGIMILVITIIEFHSLGTVRSRAVDTWTSALFFILILGICLRFLGIYRTRPATRPEPFLFPSEAPEVVDSEEGVNGAAVIGELRQLMGEEKFFREESLTIRHLAQKLNVKEYRLRRLINGHLGYRNFNRFVNAYRIEEVARQLLDPQTRHLPVLSIALDNGYRSLSPFNKAFKEIMGMTPTEYRNQHRQGFTVSASAQ